MTQIGNHYFDFEAVDNCLKDLMEVEGIGRFTLTNEASNQILNLLGVKSKETEFEIRAIRNAVVKTFSDLIQSVRDCKDITLWSKYDTLMSAITASIDNELWNRGFSV